MSRATMTLWRLHGLSCETRPRRVTMHAYVSYSLAQARSDDLKRLADDRQLAARATPANRPLLARLRNGRSSGRSRSVRPAILRS